MNQLDFKDRVAVITGGAVGIGFAVAQRLVASGARVSLWDRDPRGAVKGQGVARRRHRYAHRRRCRRRRGRRCGARCRRNAVAHRRAGVLAPGITGPNTTLWEYPVDAWKQVIDVNLNGLFYCNRAVVPFMRDKDYGRIVNIASVAGKEGNPNASAYSTSKAGVIGADQVARQGAREDRHPRQLRHACGGEDRDLRPDVAAAHRLHALEDPAGALRRGRGDRRDGGMVVQRGVLVLDRRGVRSVGRARDVLICGVRESRRAHSPRGRPSRRRELGSVVKSTSATRRRRSIFGNFFSPKSTVLHGQLPHARVEHRSLTVLIGGVDCAVRPHTKWADNRSTLLILVGDTS